MAKKRVKKSKKTQVKIKRQFAAKTRVSRKPKKRRNSKPTTTQLKKKSSGISKTKSAPRKKKTVNYDGIAKKISGNSSLKKSKVAVSTPKALIALGELVSVIYKSSADGKNYIHKFRKNAPKLAVSEKNKLFIIGGNYRVNERGII